MGKTGDGRQTIMAEDQGREQSTTWTHVVPQRKKAGRGNQAKVVRVCVGMDTGLGGGDKLADWLADGQGLAMDGRSMENMYFC